MVRYLDPSNWLALEVRSSNGKPRLLKRQDDGTISTVYTSVVGTGMSDGNCRTGEIVIGGSGVLARRPQESLAPPQCACLANQAFRRGDAQPRL